MTMRFPLAEDHRGLVLATALAGALAAMAPRPAPGQFFWPEIQQQADDRSPSALEQARSALEHLKGLIGVPAPRAATAGEPTVEQRIQQADAALQRAREIERFFDPEAPAPAAPPADALRLIPEQIQFARFYLGGGVAGVREAGRYLALQVWLANPSDEAITIHREQMRLIAGRRRLKPGRAPDHPPAVRIPVDGSFKRLSEVPHEGEVVVEPHSARDILAVFYDLPGAREVPEMTLELPAGDHTARVDLGAFALGRMEPTIELVGPKDLLAVITIGGPISDVAAGGLVEIFRKLIKRKTTRIVLAWAEDGPEVQSEVLHWLSRAMAEQQRGRIVRADSQYPAIPAGLVDLRLAALPEGTFYPRGRLRVPAYETVGEAVAASLAEPFLTIPLPALRQAITTGGPLVRPVAIRNGGRLPRSDLPFLLKLSHSSKEEIAAAAVVALGAFAAEEAIDRLVSLAREGPRPLQAAAIEVLAASRHGAAHQALKRLLEAALNGEPTVPLEILARVLSRYPRALWRDALFKLSLRGEADDRRAALAALARVGHPRIVDALAKALESDEAALRLRALKLLIARKDQRSRSIALDYTLAYMEDHLPEEEMMELLRRTKPPEAVPLLLDQLDSDSDETMEYLPLLARIGGPAARERIVEVYPQVSPARRARLLDLLEQLNSPRLLEFATKGLTSDDPSLQRRALQIFQSNASPKAVAILTRLLAETDDRDAARQLIAALGALGSPPARLALRRGWRRGGPWAELCKSQYASTLRNLSAGSQVLGQAQILAQQDEWAKAREQFDRAIELDPHLIGAWIGRAQANMRLGKREAARRDFRHVLDRDPRNPVAITCLGILKVEAGDVEEGLEFVTSRAELYADSDLFAYNSACVKALAADRIAQEDPQRAEAMRREAVDDLARSIRLGMDDRKSLAWAREDPDLQSLHGRKDFEAVLARAEKQLAEDEEEPSE